MEANRLPKSVRQIVVLQPNESGAVVPAVLFERDSGDRKKGSLMLRPFERSIRYMADAAATAAGVYASRHRESNSKRRDGWIRDINANVVRATEKGARRVKITRILMPF